MKRIYLIYIAIVGSLCLSACSGQEDVPGNKAAEEISLSAVVDEVKIMSRNPDADEYIHAAIWFSLEKNKYPEAPAPGDATEVQKATNIPIHTTISFKSGTAAYPGDEESRPRYPTTGSAYCVGFIPNSGWTPTYGKDTTTATHAITGTEDLMFAPQVEGSWNQHFPTQRFRHLLTWLKVCVCTTNSEAGSYWGKLKSIKLLGMPDELTIDLSKDDEENFKLQDAVTFSEDKKEVPILESQEGVDLGVVIQEVGSVYCKPQSSYKLAIECENGTATDVEVELKPLTNTEEELEKLAYPAGLQYVLILYFHPFNVVNGVCTLQEWNAQNEDLYPDPVTP